MRILDLRCAHGCKVFEENAHLHMGEDYPPCPVCGKQMRPTWEGGRAPATDVYGTPQWSDAADQWVSSTRHRDQVMRAHGFEPVGDKVGGARNESHLGLGKIHSIPEKRRSA